MKTLMILTLSVFLTLACNQLPDTSVLSGGNLVAFVEANSSEGTMSGDFGDIIIIDLISKKRFDVTHDSFYDAEPFWSPDGRKLGFLSNRTGSSLSRAIQGIGGPHNLCVFDLNQQKLSIINLSPLKLHVGLFWRPAWRQDGNGFYVGEKNDIWEIDLSTNKTRLLTRLNQVHRIRELSLSPNGKLLCVQFTSPPVDANTSGRDRLGVYNFQDSSFSVLARDNFILEAEWFPDGEKVLFLGPQEKAIRVAYQIWNLRTNRIALFQFPNEFPERPSTVRLSASGELLGVMRRQTIQTTKEYIPPDFFSYDSTTKKLEWLSDGTDIGDIKVFLPGTRE